MKGHDDESARRICGEMQQRLEGKSYNAAAALDRAKSNQEKKKVLSYQDNGRLFLKIFLIDGSVNMNDWGVDPRSIRRNINSAIGKPVVMYKTPQGEWDHPPLTAHSEDLDHALAFQDLYRVATYIDVFESKTKPSEWWGIAEVTDEGVKQAIREDPTIPFYVSPTIRLLNPLQNEQKLSDWSFMHSAIVDRPAFGTAKAYIGGHCSGDSNTCLLQLRKASIDANGGKVGCGFCTYKAAKNIQQKIIGVSSQLTSSQQLQIGNNIMSSDNTEKNQQPQSNDTQNTQQQQPQQQLPRQEQDQIQPQGETKTVEQVNEELRKKQIRRSENAEERGDNRDDRGENRGADNPGRQGSSAQELLEAIQRLSTQKKELELQLQTAKADNATLHSVNAQFNDRLAKLEQEREEERRITRTHEITNFVNSAPAYKLLTPQERGQQVETFVKGSMSVDEIRNIIEPLNASVQKASFGINRSASYTPRLSLGGRTGNTVEVRNASQQDQPNAEEVPYYIGLANAMFKKNGGIE